MVDGFCNIHGTQRKPHNKKYFPSVTIFRLVLTNRDDTFFWWKKDKPSYKGRHKHNNDCHSNGLSFFYRRRQNKHNTFFGHSSARVAVISVSDKRIHIFCMPRQICDGWFDPPLLVDTLYGTCTHVCVKVKGTRRSRGRHKFEGSKAESIPSTQPIERISSSHQGAWLDWHRVGQGDIHPLHSLAPCTLEFKGELSAYPYVITLRRELWWVWQTERENEREAKGVSYEVEAGKWRESES